jgi:uncharacterized membrane protein YheB (UPF0754 family)
MEFFLQISNIPSPFLRNIWVQITLLILFATVHGYAGAWLAVRMLFRPRKAVKLLGLTVFPQGMIPRHRERLANAIGKAVGDELVSTDTVVQQLTGNDFLKRKIQAVVDSYTTDILSQSYPSFIEILPKNLREPVLDSVSQLQRKIADHIESVFRSEESIESIRGFVERRVDDMLSQRVSDVLDEKTFLEIVGFLEERVRSAVNSKSFETNIRDFVSRRIDDLFQTETPLGQMFTDDAISLLKDKANDQIQPVVHHLTELAAAERTRNQISSLIKREVHEYYESLPFFKKIFVSRDNLLRDVDVLVNESLPKRIEETLRGDIFAKEAKSFISNGIDNALMRPLPELIGTINPEQLERLKSQVATSIFSIIRSEETMKSISAYITDTLSRLRPHSIDAIMQTLHPESEAKLKNMLSNGLLNIISTRDTQNVINSVVASQIDRLLSAPIGNLSDHVSEDKVRNASQALTDAIVAATSEKLPEAVREFNVGGVVREKILNYPAEKLENLVLSVAQEHLRTIELFGALFGFLIGVAQAVQFYFFAH